MDFLEKIFERYWKTSRQKIASKSSTLKAESIKKYISTVVRFLLEQNSPIEVSGSLYSVGFYNETLLLPDQIGLFSDKNQNKAAYLYLTLVSCATRKLRLFIENETDSKVESRLFTLKKMPEINSWLDCNILEFRNFQSKYFDFLFEKVGSGVSEKYNRFLLSYLKLRSSQDAQLFEQDWFYYQLQIKRNDILPEVLHLTLLS